MKTITGKPCLRGLNAAQGELGWAVASLLAVGQMVPRIRPECDTLSMKVLGLIREIGDPGPEPNPTSALPKVGAGQIGHVSYLAPKAPPSGPGVQIGHVSNLARIREIAFPCHPIKPGHWIMSFPFPTSTKRIVLGLLVFQLGWSSRQGTRTDLHGDGSDAFSEVLGMSGASLLRARRMAEPFRHLSPEGPIHLMKDGDIIELMELVQKEWDAKTA